MQATTKGLLIVVTLWASSAFAVERPFAPVPPSLEIEVLDPGVDPLGNPAVIVKSKNDGEQFIDIPPAVLVHRYYYTGDRSFQAQLLPGGPSIVVVNHPHNGERCYIPVQMLPGAPRVTYTKHSIIYDFGQNAITLKFGPIGKPKVKYRSGVPWVHRAKNLVHAEQVRQKTQNLAVGSQQAAQRGTRIAVGATAVVKDQTDRFVVTPTRQALGLLPVVGPVFFSGDLGDRLETRAYEHMREKAVRRAERARGSDATYATIR